MEENKTKIKSFTDLYAWKKAHKLVVLIYKTTERFPQKETFGLADQSVTVHKLINGLKRIHK